MLSAQDCLQDLERLSQENSSDTRREMLRRLTDLFFATEEQRENTDTDMFGSVMGNLAYALEVEARVELSTRLSTSTKAPRKLLIHMANDEIEIAQPLLESSSELTDADLVSIANDSSQDHLLAITKRDSLSEVVTDVIVERGDDIVLESVALNQGAHFSNEGFDTLTNCAETCMSVRDAMSARSDVPEKFFERIKGMLANKLVSEIANGTLDISTDDIHSVVVEKVSEISKMPAAKSNTRQMLAERHEMIAYEEDDLINLARARRVEETIEILSLITDLDPRMIHHCILDADLAALGILCKASDFKDNTYAALLQLRLNIKGMPSHLAISEMKRYKNLTPSSAKRVLRFLKVRISTDTP